MKCTLPLLLKSSVALLIVLFQLPVFATDYYSLQDGEFDNPKTWALDKNGLIKATIVEFDNGKNNFFIMQGDEVTISSDLPISINKLEISGLTRFGIGTLKILTDVKNIQINGSLTLTDGLLDFGINTVRITLTGDLINGSGSTIQQAADKGKTQQLILNGPSNEVRSYVTSGTGINEVIYSGEKQTIFPSTYSTLKILNKGQKILSGEITVSKSLTISDTYVVLDKFNLIYEGNEINLKLTNGWVYTNGSGAYVNSNIFSNEIKKTFPVGNAFLMQKIILTGGDIGSKQISIRFMEDLTGLPNGNGMGAWNLNSLNALIFTATIYPQPDDAKIINDKSKIAINLKGDPVWQVQSTTFSTASYTLNTPITIDGGDYWFMLYNCPEYSFKTTSLPTAYIGTPYNTTFSITSNDGTPIDMNNLITTSPLPDKFVLDKDTLKSGFVPGPPVDKYKLAMNYTDNVGCVLEKDFSLVIANRPSPNLSMLPIDTKTFGADSFRVRTYSRSSGKITYTISGGCATINDTSGFVNITCAGPSPNNLITVTASQIATSTYKDESVSKSFIINPSPGRIYIKNFAFLTNTSASIKVATKSSPAAISFEQLSGFNVATVIKTTGSLNTELATGEFTVRISLAATPNYTAFDSVYTFNVYTLNKPPLAVGDSIVLEMGKDTTFNVLLNDRGQTGEIIPKNTDIDMDNRGQQVKYYATELGNFNIDTAGNLTVLPFYGFIGSGRLGYTVSDNNGLTSEIAYVEVTVKPPYVIPELKANDIMTPNNDNLNDALVIANTDLNKENSLLILDELGNKVYEKTNYQNDWEGIDIKNNKLEPGVYFYVFKEKNTGRELKNFIQIL